MKRYIILRDESGDYIHEMSLWDARPLVIRSGDAEDAKRFTEAEARDLLNTLGDGYAAITEDEMEWL